MAQEVKNVMIIGGSGLLGSEILTAVLKLTTPKLNISVLTRASSKAQFPSTVKVVKIAEDYPLDSLTDAFKGQDAVVSAHPATTSSLSIRFVDACVAAGVKRYIPSDFGNNTCQPAFDQVPLYAEKAAAGRHLAEVTQAGQRGDKLTWTMINCGQFFDWGLEAEWLAYDLAKREVTIYDSGDRKWSTTNIATVATAVTKVLVRPLDDPAVKNKHLLISSFTVSQNEVLKLLEDADPEGKKWNVKRMSSEEALEMAKTAEREEALRLRVTMLLYADGEDKGANFENDERWANELLGLEKEDLRSVVDKIVKKASKNS